MEHTKELLSVPLASLVASRYNVRRHTSGQVEELAALIGAQGLLHNLVVTEQVVGRGKGTRSSSRSLRGSGGAARCCCCNSRAVSRRRTKCCASWCRLSGRSK